MTQKRYQRMLKIFMLLLFFSFSIQAQESKDKANQATNTEQKRDKSKDDITLSDPDLSIKYQRGRFLLYDCEDKHWVCTKKLEFDRCGEKRKYVDFVKEQLYPCAPIKAFASEAECVKRQRKFIQKNHSVRSCLSKSSKFLEQTY